MRERNLGRLGSDNPEVVELWKALIRERELIDELALEIEQLIAKNKELEVSADPKD